MHVHATNQEPQIHSVGEVERNPPLNNVIAEVKLFKNVSKGKVCN